MRNILITGGAGFIGTYTAELAVKKGYSVTILDNLMLSEEPNPKKLIKFIKGDVKDLNLVRALVDEATGGVIHLAADSRVLPSLANGEAAYKCVETNILGTINVLRSIVELHKPVPLVYAASSTAYGNMPTPQTETMLPNPQTPYAASKLAGEFLIQSFCETFGISATCLRYFQVYGQGQPNQGAYALVTGIFAKQFLDGTPLTIEGDGKQSRDFVHVEDVALANILAIENQFHGMPINIGTGESLKILELANMFGGEIQQKPPRKIDLLATKADTTLAQKMLNFKANNRISHWVSSIKNQNG
jgi:UDP-glucose 4-epimerase